MPLALPPAPKRHPCHPSLQRRPLRLLLPLLLLLLGPLPLLSQNPSPTPNSTPSLEHPLELFLDQPKGLGEHPFAWKLAYTAETFSLLSGGLHPGITSEGLLKWGFGLNLERLCGWDHTVLYANLIQSHGEGLTDKHSGDLNVLSNIDTPDRLRLFKLWAQTLLWEHTLSLRIGLMAVDKEFFVSDGAALFLNSGFGALPIVSQGLRAPVFPISAPGIRCLWKPSDRFFVRTGLFSGDVGSPSSNPHNTQWNWGSHHGIASFWEAGSHFSTGTVKVGTYYDSRFFEDLRGREPHHGNFGFYGILDQMLFAQPHRPDAPPRGLAAFLRGAAAPKDRNFIPYDLEGGLTYTGLFPSRQTDVLGLGLVYTRVSDAALDPLLRPFPTHAETVLELTYQAALSESLSLQPDFQLIQNPSGTQKTPRAIVAGLRVNLLF